MFLISSKEKGLVQLIRAHKRILTYGIVGGINTGVDFAVFMLLYAFTPLAAPIRQAIGYTVGILCSFILNRNVTFRDGIRLRLSHEVGRFVAVNLVSLATSMLVIYLLEDMLGVPATLAKAMVTVLTATINYFGYKVFVFRVKGK